MSLWEIAALGLWAGAIGFYLGLGRGLERGRRERTLRFTGREVRVVLDWSGIERLLDERGMIAMPKGADFRPREERAE